MGKDYYKILGLGKNFTEDELKRNYKKNALEYHPDKNKDPSAEEKFREIAEAYDVLRDPEKRAIYDQLGEEGLKGGIPPSGAPDFSGGFPGGGRSFKFHSFSSGGGHGAGGYRFNQDPREIFAQFFGSSSPFHGGDDMGDFLGSTLSSSKKSQPSPIDRELMVSLEELFTGTTKKMKIKKQVKKDHKSPLTIEEKILTITVRQGWKAGTKITFPNEGDQLPNQTPADIVFTIQEKFHSLFKRQGSDLIHTVRLPLVDALVGSMVSVPTIEGKPLQVRINPVAKPGDRKVLQGYGMPISKSPEQRGALILEFDIVFPDQVTLSQRDALVKAFK